MCEPDITPPRSFRCLAWLVAAACLLSGAPFPAVSAEIAVGPDRPLKTLAAGIAAAGPHDVILLDPGFYVDDVATTTVPLTIEGRAGFGSADATVLRSTRPIANRKGILVSGADLTVRHLSFETAQVLVSDGGNGAGIVGVRGNLTVEDCVFINNQNGILVYPDPTVVVTISRTVFDGNGRGDGFTHAVYVNEVAALTITDSSFNGTKIGHDIKSRALKTTIRDTLLEDGLSGTASYAVDLPNGGVARLEGLRIVQGPNTSNLAMIAFGAEGELKTDNSLSISRSAFVNSADACESVAVANFASPKDVVLVDITFEGVSIAVRNVGSWRMIWTRLTDKVTRWLGRCSI